MLYRYTCAAPDCRIKVTGLGYRRRHCHLCGAPVSVQPSSALGAAHAAAVSSPAYALLRQPFVRELAAHGRDRATRFAAHQWVVNYDLSRSFGHRGARGARFSAALDWNLYAPAGAQQVLTEAMQHRPPRRQVILAQLFAADDTPPAIQMADVWTELEDILAGAPH